MRTLDADTNQALSGVTVTVQHADGTQQTFTTSNRGGYTFLAEPRTTIEIGASMSGNNPSHLPTSRRYRVPAYQGVVNLLMEPNADQIPTSSVMFRAINAETGEVISGAIFIVTKEGFGSQSSVGSSVVVSAQVGTNVHVRVVKGGQNGFDPAEMNYTMQLNNSPVSILMTPY